MAMHYEGVLAPTASSWRNTAVRFAEVDCAVDKALCNDNKVEMYPSVAHFEGGKLSSRWELSSDATSLSGDVSKWVRKVLAAKPSVHGGSQAAGEDDKGEALSGGATMFSHLRELAGLFSWKDPTTAAYGYFILAASVVAVVWIIGTGLELDVKAVLGMVKQSKAKQWPSALLPDMPEMPQSRTIVRNSFTL